MLGLIAAAIVSLPAVDAFPDWNLPLQGGFISAATSDPLGALWIGTAVHGLWHCAQSGDRQWKQVTQKQGLAADNIAALASDKEGRIWVGHVNAGLSIGNGKSWKTYGPLDSPIGDHVACLCFSPIDGRMWIGSDMGLSSWRQDEGWTHQELSITDEPTCLAVDPKGAVLVGTSCHGVLLFNGDPRRPGWIPLAIPTSKDADSLGDQINAITTTPGRIWVGSAAGLSVSGDRGQSWRSVRGPMRDNSKSAKPDPVMSLYPCPGEKMIVGLRHHGLTYIDNGLSELRALASDPAKKNADWVSALLIPTPGQVAIGWWGGGLTYMADEGMLSPPRSPNSLIAGESPPFPSYYPAPTVTDLSSMLSRLKREKGRQLAPNSGYLLGKDYLTRGDWVGRYGRQGAILCAASAPLDHELVLSTEVFDISCRIGPHATKDDGVRHWIHWLQSTNSNVLWDPFIGARRQAEWDDHGEAYAMSAPGPDLVVTVSIDTPGIFRLGGYFFNKDGFMGSNRFRDFLVDLKRAPSDRGMDPDKYELLARTRIHQFDQGVYTRFVVSGPGKYIVHIKRNASFNTIVSGIFIDRMVGPNTEGGLSLPMLGGLRYDPPDEQFTPNELNGNEALIHADELWTWLDAHQNEPIEHERSLRLAAYRCALASVHDDNHPVLRTWRWHFPLWTDADRKEFRSVMQDAFVRQSAQNAASHPNH